LDCSLIADQILTKYVILTETKTLKNL